MQKASIILIIIFAIPILVFSQAINQLDDMGQKQGRWIKNYRYGNVRYTGQFKDDRPYGQFKYFYKSGALQAVSNYSVDGVIAITQTFHENGAPMAEGKYVRQKKDGKWKYYSDIDSCLIAEEHYKHGVLEGESITYYPETGNSAEIFIYTAGKREGPYRKFFPDGNKMTKGTYTNDLLEGDFTLYYPNGKIQLKGQYKNGQQIGNWNYFDEEGNAIQEEDFKNNKEE